MLLADVPKCALVSTSATAVPPCLCEKIGINVFSEPVPDFELYAAGGKGSKSCVRFFRKFGGGRDVVQIGSTTARLNGPKRHREYDASDMVPRGKF